ncbi:ATP synthase [Vulcanococcus sp.]|uniref:ATP synthase n=1 Tax=Vulcanococcus sp. TaxID=2856995 RepID=UPI003C0EDF67
MIDSARLFRAKAPLLASPPTQSDADRPLGDSTDQTEGNSQHESPEALEPQSPAGTADSPSSPDGSLSSDSDDFERLQRRLILFTLMVSALAVPITALIYDLHTASSLLVGGLAGALYLRLLARSVGKVGNGAKKVGKLQLLVPVVLVMAAIRLPQLEILPAFLGFLLYKPAVILQMLTDR